ncbi:peptide-N(4)-(N-acetyl-beta-glucosaminyl)asparagine amidase isoform X2 [Cephus cinctus]|uniref:Peptide-N(4)-(N-acetyl-beta-glucosaminyl)asparagine amidase n=1 Tax=Cephus cinctus TaxID=211228 RepID=A0AAJ7BLR6_CEPCN|nr:peptide-N(4)-(N-acetyl-beta-glucosaminyl)asparagine amidase isoform X2 [Cephus cinctus]
MTNLKRYVDLLRENDEKIYREAQKILSILCKNIIDNPQKEEYRKKDDHLFLPKDAPLTKTYELRQLLSSSDIKTQRQESVAQPSIQPTVSKSSVTSMEFLDKIRLEFADVLKYENPTLQAKAKSIVPLTRLQTGVVQTLRSVQRDIKVNGNEGNTEEDTIIENLLLAELLRWFKLEFFQWVDSPPCYACSGPCKYSYTVKSKDPRILRIEIHRCTSCGTQVKFPRYSDLQILLITRQGRCGEWARIFTLLCRSLGYDARLVWDKTDHLWTEVWSPRSGRWIHADPCENVMDRPLMYEKGWGKKLTYIIAFSRDEVQDVTWRYTMDQESVMKRRTLITEEALISFIRKLNLERQTASGYSEARRQYVVKRNLLELVEMLPAPPGKEKPHVNEDYQGRSSGSLTWRLSRGEVSNSTIKESYSWKIPKDLRQYELCYYAAKDIYHIRGKDGSVLEQRTGWQKGLHTTEGGVFRKVEEDWKVVYLARSPGAQSGLVKWSFEVLDTCLRIDSFSFQVITRVFHGAKIQWILEAFYQNAESKILCLSNCNNTFTTNDDVKGAIKVFLSATLMGGKDDLAWQHAQLFRQSLQSEEHSLLIQIRLVEYT